jgi:hypothetical protein
MTGHPQGARIAGREIAAAWQELRNKARAYWLVGLQRGAPRRGATLAELTAELCLRQPETAAFHLERLGYDFALAEWRRRGEPPCGLLADAALPEASLVLLHSGLGLALSRRLLRPFGAGSPAADLAAGLERLLALIEANARPDLAPVAIEAAGLIVRMFLPRLRAATARWMRAASPDLEGLFWHGIGRAVYFVPASSWPRPGALRHALALCRREPPDAATRQHALAGLAFAVTMINWQQPLLIERLFALLEIDAERAGGADPAGAGGSSGPPLPPRWEGEAEAFASGVAACLFVQRFTLPNAPPPPVLQHLPDAASDPRRRELWERHVRQPCAAALEQLYPRLVARRELSRFAWFQPLGGDPIAAVPRAGYRG